MNKNKHLKRIVATSLLGVLGLTVKSDMQAIEIEKIFAWLGAAYIGCEIITGKSGVAVLNKKVFGKKDGEGLAKAATDWANK